MSLPCFLLPGGIVSESTVTRLIVVAVTAALPLLIAMRKYFTLAVNAKSEQLELGLNPKSWSTLLLVGWDFRVGGGVADRSLWQENLARATKSLYANDVSSQLDQFSAGRFSHCRWLRLHLRAISAALLMALLLAVALALVSASLVFHKAIASYFKQLFPGETAALAFGEGFFIPVVVVFSVGLCLPLAVRIIVFIAIKDPASRAHWIVFYSW
eukprot:TRINITY_DN30037_c0_g1_i1.p1 TRINITY_DN30037_c0_g1~~TRINITY_DN30037_c0_g1_i1.p1  ORF type:complete len:241 (+),score=24.51 TRINITY_DN30037_c0_g1_i1:87-725(+)